MQFVSQEKDIFLSLINSLSNLIAGSVQISITTYDDLFPERGCPGARK